jgi:hypothetical protein
MEYAKQIKKGGAPTNLSIIHGTWIMHNHSRNYRLLVVVVNRNFKVHVMGLISRLSGECVCPP